MELVVRQGVSSVVFALLARLLEPSSFGLFALISTYLFFAGMFANQGFGSALIQFPRLTDAHCDSVFWFNLACAIVLCAGTMLLAHPIAHAIGDTRVALLLRWTSLTLVINAASTIHNTLFVKALNFRGPALRTMVANSLSGVVGIALALGGAEVGALVGQQITASLASSLFLWKASSYRPRARFSWQHIRELQPVGLPTFGTSFLWTFTNRIDQIAIGKIAGPATLGLYTVAAKLPEIIKQVLQEPVSQISVPALAALQSDPRRMCDAIYAGIRIHAAISIPVYVGLALVSHEIVPLFFGSKWSAAAPLCAVFAFSALVLSMQVFAHPALLATGGAGRYLIVSMGQALGVTSASFLGIRYSIDAVVWGIVGTHTLCGLAGLFMLRGRIGLSPLRFLSCCSGPAVAAALMATVVLISDRILPGETPTWIRLAIKIATGSLTYLGSVAYLAPETLERLRVFIERALPIRPRSF